MNERPPVLFAMPQTYDLHSAGFVRSTMEIDGQFKLKMQNPSDKCGWDSSSDSVAEKVGWLLLEDTDTESVAQKQVKQEEKERESGKVTKKFKDNDVPQKKESTSKDLISSSLEVVVETVIGSTPSSLTQEDGGLLTTEGGGRGRRGESALERNAVAGAEDTEALEETGDNHEDHVSTYDASVSSSSTFDTDSHPAFQVQVRGPHTEPVDDLEEGEEEHPLQDGVQQPSFLETFMGWTGESVKPNIETEVEASGHVSSTDDLSKYDTAHDSAVPPHGRGGGGGLHTVPVEDDTEVEGEDEDEEENDAQSVAERSAREHLSDEVTINPLTGDLDDENTWHVDPMRVSRFSDAP